jgi:Na+-translocating ferredoxin:NAD+ oxidoreductase subunit C
LFGTPGMRGGIHLPPEKKRTFDSASEAIAPPPYVIIQMLQHTGSPASPYVNIGDHVRAGQLIGVQAGQLSASIHASISGTVTEIDKFPHPSGRLLTGIKIENDNTGETEQIQGIDKPWKEAAPGELVQIISSAGIVEMDGDPYPAHVKLSPPANKPVHTLIINGMEDDPFITADSRLLLEKTEEVLTGVLIVKKILGADNSYIAIEASKQGIYSGICGIANDQKFKEITLVKLKNKYPQGADKMLVTTLTGKQVPSGGDLVDCGCVVLNVATIYAIYNAICNNIPLYERLITVNGPAVRSPKNLKVPVGTSLSYILEYCDTDMSLAKKIVLGGAMTGTAQPDLAATVQKSSCGILAFDKLVEGRQRYNCINCGNCLKACPVRLVPSMIAKQIDDNKLEEASRLGLADCIECGSCAYVCPARINLVHFMKLGKHHIDIQNSRIVQHGN